MNDANCVESKTGKNKNYKKQKSLSVDNKKNKQKRARIIVRNVSYKANEDNLREYFKKFGNITDIQLLKRPDGKLVGCAFIQFETVNQAAKAILKCTNKDFLGRQIFLDWAVGKDKYDNKKNHNNNKKISNDKNELNNTDNSKNEFINDNDKIKKSFSSSEDENDDNMSKESDDDAGSDEDEKEDKNKKDKSMKKFLSNDVKDGRTVFLKNVPFDAKNNDIKEICKKFGKIIYALINCDPISGHSKGTAFVRFETKESADLLLSANKNNNELILMDSILEVYPALSRNEIKEQNKLKLNDNCNKDLRNLYLAKEGLIMAGSKAAEGVSASDMAKRHKLEKIKAQILKNLNRFVSRNRLSIHNLPLSYDDEKLKKMIITYTKLKPFECRVMRENKPSIEYPNGKSKGFGFASFKTHEDALFVLRKLNNNPNVFGQKNRPIVAFSIEDKTVHNIKEKRLKKSQQNNPTFKNKLEKEDKNCIETKNKKKLKNQENKNNLELKDAKKIIQEINKNNDNYDIENFMGTSSKPGEFVRLRSNQKIKSQFKVHLKNVSKLKRLEKRKKEKLINLKEKQNKNDNKKLKIIKKNKTKNNESDHFNNLIEKYKNLIDTKAASQDLNANNMLKKKSKWYKE